MTDEPQQGKSNEQDDKSEPERAVFPPNPAVRAEKEMVAESTSSQGPNAQEAQQNSGPGTAPSEPEQPE